MAPEAPGPILAAEGVAKGFGSGPARVEVFRGVALTVEGGDFVAVMGPSGSGKSTLLHLLAGLDRPDAGTVRLLGRDWAALDPAARASLRGESIGFVFQLHHLLPELTAAENVALPLLLAGRAAAEARREALASLTRVDLASRADALPRTLSGGERQRVALARAVVRRPRLLLCDEPTGSLDAAHAAEVFALLQEVARERAGAAVVVTHDPAWARRCATIKTLTAEGLLAVDGERVPTA